MCRNECHLHLACLLSAWTESLHSLLRPARRILRLGPGASDGKESACSVGDSGWIPGSGRFPVAGTGYPLQYSCLENSMKRRAWRATVHGVTESNITKRLTERERRILKAQRSTQKKPTTPDLLQAFKQGYVSKLNGDANSRGWTSASWFKRHTVNQCFRDSASSGTPVRAIWRRFRRGWQRAVRQFLHEVSVHATKFIFSRALDSSSKLLHFPHGISLMILDSLGFSWGAYLFMKLFSLFGSLFFWFTCNSSAVFPGSSASKESTCNAGDMGSIPGLGRSPGEGNGYPLQYSGLQNSMACIVHGVTKSRTRLSDFHFHKKTFLKSENAVMIFRWRVPEEVHLFPCHLHPGNHHQGLPWWLCSKESTCQVQSLVGCPGEGKGNPLQYSCLGNPTDRGAWQAT